MELCAHATTLDGHTEDIALYCTGTWCSGAYFDPYSQNTQFKLHTWFSALT